MVDATSAERGAFREEDIREADRATPSVAEAGGGNGRKPLWMWVAMAGGTALAIWLIVILPMQREKPVETVVTPEPVAVDRSQRAVDRTFPGTGFDLEEPAPQTVAPVQTTGEDPNPRERALLLQIEKLQLELQQAREENAQRARTEALRLQIQAAQAAEAERVKRLRSDVVIGDFSGDRTETGPRDLPNEPTGTEEDAGGGDAAPEDGAPVDLLRGLGTIPGAGDREASGFPPALLDQLREQGVDLTPGGQP